jgi:hydrogenase maturation protease
MNAQPRVLVIGYGNPGRLDDGLGPALAERLGDLAGEHLTIDSDYQLTLEDAAAIAEHDIVIFVDADISGPVPFHFTRIQPAEEVSFSTHSIRAESLLGLADTLFGKQVEGYVLGIRGYEFDDFGEGLSDRAVENLAAAERSLRSILKHEAGKAYTAFAHRAKEYAMTIQEEQS